MKINCICRQRLKEDGTKRGVEYLTIDGGWTEITEWAAIFTPVHAKYTTEKFSLKHKDENIEFFAREYITL